MARRLEAKQYSLGAGPQPLDGLERETRQKLQLRSHQSRLFRNKSHKNAHPEGVNYSKLTLSIMAFLWKKKKNPC